jgi:exopolysaccharide biosynthesis polyprenyl glycosylphosphotransferase
MSAKIVAIQRENESSMNNPLWRRVTDLIIACTLILVTLPFLAIFALTIKLDSSGPVFYQQERVGLGGRRFMLIKFRSMVRDAEPDGQPVWAAERDLRITRVGRFLRCTRLDELPQLFNVLRGDMSMIGPRPERPYFVDQLNKAIPSFSERLTVNPGITGWAQVKYPYTASVKDANTKLSYDLYYIRNRSIVLDFIILLCTARIVISQKGAR